MLLGNDHGRQLLYTILLCATLYSNSALLMQTLSLNAQNAIYAISPALYKSISEGASPSSVGGTEAKAVRRLVLLRFAGACRAS